MNMVYIKNNVPIQKQVCINKVVYSTTISLSLILALFIPYPAPPLALPCSSLFLIFLSSHVLFLPSLYLSYPSPLLLFISLQCPVPFSALHMPCPPSLSSIPFPSVPLTLSVISFPSSVLPLVAMSCTSLFSALYLPLSHSLSVISFPCSDLPLVAMSCTYLFSALYMPCSSLPLCHTLPLRPALSPSVISFPSTTLMNLI